MRRPISDDNSGEESNADELTTLDTEDEDYNAGRVESEDEDDDDLEEAELLAADLLEQLIYASKPLSMKLSQRPKPWPLFTKI